jgi:hypothetical protein
MSGGAGELEAGRELDAEVARQVFGDTVWPDPKYGPRRSKPGSNDGILQPIPPYSSEIGAAWAVVERMRELYYSFAYVQSHDMASFLREPWAAFSLSVAPPRWGTEPKMFEGEVIEWRGSGPAPLAICRAALRAVGVEGRVVE